MDVQLKILIFSALLNLSTGSSYLYDYSSDVSVFSDEKLPSHKLILSLQSKVKVTTVWTADTNHAEKLLRFQIENFELRGSTNSSSKHIQLSESSLAKNALLVKPFFARFLYGKLQDFYVDESSSEDDSNLYIINFQRGLVSLFQFQPGNWEGDEIDILGNCWTSYTNDQHGLHKKKSKCQKELEKNQSYQLFGVKESFRYDGLYHLQDGDEIISKAKVSQVVKQEIHLHPSNPRWTKVNQLIVLKGQTNPENGMMGATIKDALEKLASKDNLVLKRYEILAQKVELKNSETKVKNLVAKVKRNLRSASLATLSGAKAFLQVRDSVLRANKDDLVAVLKEKKNSDILPQLMDIYGSAGSLAAHKASIETFANPIQTTRADLCERYLWAISQIKEPDTQIVTDMFAFAKDKISNLKIKATVTLTLGTLARKTTDLRLSANIVKWLVHSMVESCKNDDCIQMFLRSIENSENINSAPILLQLVETSSNKKTAFAAMKSFAHLLTVDFAKVEDKIKHLDSRLLSIYMNQKIDTTVRVIAAEIILQIKPGLEMFKEFFSSLKSEKKGFASYVISRIAEYSENDEELRNIIGSCVNRGFVDWNLLSHGGLSTSFGRQVGSAGKAGSSNFSFAMEISGVVLKRSNFQLFFQDRNGVKTDLVQLGVFAGGMSNFIDDGSKEEKSKDESSKDDDEEATAGIEIKFLGNKLRPFIFFSSMGELMSLYWSGASEEKTSALQGSVLLQNEKSEIILSNGFTVLMSTDGAISYDFSGQAKVSMWSKQSESLIDNSFAYSLQNKVKIFLAKDDMSISYEQQMETETTLKVENNIDFGSSGVKVCIRVSQPELQLDLNTSKSVRGSSGVPQIVESKKKIVVPGKTLFLNRKNCQLCNNMYPKSK